jgi:CO dehydrogenase maturation factor
MSEEGSIDMLVMGRPEGEGCYCFTNDVLKNCFNELLPNYKFTVIDDEAGMEHMSRRVLPKADILIFVSDPTKTGVRTAARLASLADEVKIEAGRKILVINNVFGEVSKSLLDEVLQLNFDSVFVMPHDDFISKSAMEGEELDVPADTSFGKAMAEFIKQITK